MVVEVDSSGRAEATLAVLKPDAVAAGKASEMELAIEAAGFTVLCRREVQVRARPPPTSSCVSRPPGLRCEECLAAPGRGGAILRAPAGARGQGARGSSWAPGGASRESLAALPLARFPAPPRPAPPRPAASPPLPLRAVAGHWKHVCSAGSARKGPPGSGRRPAEQGRGVGGAGRCLRFLRAQELTGGSPSG